MFAVPVRALAATKPVFVLVFLILAGNAGPALAQAGDNDPIVMNNLSQLLDVKSYPCGGVSSYERQDAFQFLVTCNNGSRYLINRNQVGEVVVQPVE